MTKTNREIYEARVALAKIANTDMPLQLIMQITPLLAECEGVIEKALQYEKQNGEDFERYMNGVRELPNCVLPALPQIRMSYVEYKSLGGIIQFEEVETCLKS